jgi:hypothetical protein
MQGECNAMRQIAKRLDEPSPSLLDAFRVRCEARAYLFAVAEISLHEAVDRLQADAVKSGLVDRIGQDAIQQIMVDAFAEVRDDCCGDDFTSSELIAKNSTTAPEACDICTCEPKACRDADKDPKIIAQRQRAAEKLPPDWDQMSFGALAASLNNPARLSRKGRAARSTVDAVAYALRKGGKTALKAEAARLEEFSDRQIEALIRQLKKSGADEQLLLALVELLP